MNCGIKVEQNRLLAIRGSQERCYNPFPYRITLLVHVEPVFEKDVGSGKAVLAEHGVEDIDVGKPFVGLCELRYQ